MRRLSSICPRMGLFAFLVVFLAVLVQAQFKAGLQGTVTDLSGAVMPGAKVTVTSLETGSRAITFAAASLNRPLPMARFSMRSALIIRSAAIRAIQLWGRELIPRQARPAAVPSKFMGHSRTCERHTCIPIRSKCSRS